jgi:hypothetical protein
MIAWAEAIRKFKSKNAKGKKREFRRPESVVRISR